MGPPALCNRCRREILPRLSQPSWHREKHRATKAEREPEPSPAAQKVLRKKQRSSLRAQIKLHGLIETTKTFLKLKGQPHPLTMDAPPDDCPACLKLQADQRVA